jgi:hypothetical protein
MGRITAASSGGDKIELVLPMKIQGVKGINKIVATRGQLALRRGPLIYSVESADNEDIENVLGPDAALSAEWRTDLLGGVNVIKSTWADGSRLTAIPYYARNNRTLDTPEGSRLVRSTVWIKDRPKNNIP